jgi:Protein of unknown function (DUF3405)
MLNEVVLYRTHMFSPTIIGEFLRLRAELSELDHRVIGYIKDTRTERVVRWCRTKLRISSDISSRSFLEPPAPIRNLKDSCMYRRQHLETLPYPMKIGLSRWTSTRGDNDLPVLAFYKQNPDYDFYWIVEYDVRYTAHWGQLFSELRQSPADLLCTTAQDQHENPDWYFWRTLVDVPASPLTPVRAFLPFCRVSNRAMAAIDRWYQAGGAGHYEVTWASICKSAGLDIQDIGGEGSYTPENWRQKYYTNSPMHPLLSPGTFVFRPEFSDAFVSGEGSASMGRPMLWHPVKS